MPKKNGLTLVEQSKIAAEQGNKLQATTMEIYAQSSALLLHLPFININGGNTLIYNRQILNGIERVQELLYVTDEDIDIDSTIAKNSLEERRKREIQLISILSTNLTNVLINADSENNADGFNGLKSRCINSQLIKSNADLSLNELDKLISIVNNPTHLMMNENTCDKLCATNKYISYSTDIFDRKVAQYRDLTIIILGKDTTFMETCSSSIYCLSIGGKNGIVGLQKEEMQVRYLGEIDIKPVYRTHITWCIGLITLQKNAVARLKYNTN